MTWDDVQEEMSIAGNPEKITEAGKKIMEIAGRAVDENNAPDLTNMLFALDRVKAEIKGAIRRLEQRTGQKLI